MGIEFEGEIWHWRGPSPYHFVTIPDEQSGQVKAIARSVTYGWGVIPARVSIGQTVWKTSLFPKDGRYVVPIRDDVRKTERLKIGDKVTLRLEIG